MMMTLKRTLDGKVRGYSMHGRVLCAQCARQEVTDLTKALATLELQKLYTDEVRERMCEVCGRDLDC